MRYSIEEINGDKYAYLYAIQRKKIYGEDKRINDIERSICKINSKVKDYRDLTPSKVLSLVIFLGLAKSEGINKVKMIDFVNRHYLHFHNVETQKEMDEVQFRATEKFLKLALRIASQFKGVEVTALPNDIYSNLHLNITSNNGYIQKAFDLGKNINCVDANLNNQRKIK